MNHEYLRIVFLVLCCCGAKLVIPCTQDEFDVNAKACLMNEFFNSIKENPKQDCSAVYLSMKICINTTFYGCKNNTDPQILTTIANRARAVIGSENYYCKDGMLNSFKRVNLQPDCRKKATKKVKNCVTSFHKEFSEDKASSSLCRKYTKAKNCVKTVLEKFCKNTARIQYILKIYQDSFNPYCPGNVDRRKPPGGSCSFECEQLPIHSHATVPGDFVDARSQCFRILVSTGIYLKGKRKLHALE